MSNVKDTDLDIRQIGMITELTLGNKRMPKHIFRQLPLVPSTLYGWVKVGKWPFARKVEEFHDRVHASLLGFVQDKSFNYVYSIDGQLYRSHCFIGSIKGSSEPNRQLYIGA